MTHKLINSPEQLDEAIAATLTSNDTLVVRGKDGVVWEFDGGHEETKPEEGWGTALSIVYPVLVLWYPGSIILTAYVNGEYLDTSVVTRR